MLIHLQNKVKLETFSSFSLSIFLINLGKLSFLKLMKNRSFFRKDFVALTEPNRESLEHNVTWDLIVNHFDEWKRSSVRYICPNRFQKASMGISNLQTLITN